MKNYLEHAALSGLVLEESYVLRIQAGPGFVEFRMDFALADSHPDYDPQHEGPYSTRPGRLSFSGVTDLVWHGQGSPPAVDASGEQDYGAIDALTWEGRHYRLEGDWGTMEVDAGELAVSLEEGPSRP